MIMKSDRHVDDSDMTFLDARFLCGIKCFLLIINILVLMAFINLYASNQYINSLSKMADIFRNDTKNLMSLQNELSLQNIRIREQLKEERVKAKNLIEKRVTSSTEYKKIVTRKHVTQIPYGVSRRPHQVTRRLRVCQGCFQHDYKYIIDNEAICKDNGVAIDVLLVVFSTHSKRKARQALRQTWLSVSKNNTGNIRYAFLFGNIKNATENKLLQEENFKFRDIIQENFVDSYQNLTVKTIMGFKWASTKCSRAKYVMKADDDVYVNIPGVMRKIRNHGQLLQNRIGGVCKRKTKPDRNPKSKWYISFEMYPEKVIPEFCSGTAYLTSMNVARNIFKISKDVPYVNLEDVYISLCIRELGYKFLDIFGFNAMRTPMKYCVFKRPQYVTAHSYSPSEMKEIWNTKC